MPGILATQDAEIWRVMVQSQPRQKEREKIGNNQHPK
jgi:hypothetical protein